MTPVKISIAAAIASLLLILIVLELIRGRRLKERYALLWLVTGLVLLVLSAWRGGLNTIAGWLGVETYPPAILFAVATLFIIIVLLHYSTVLSQLDDQNTVLAQRLALLEPEARASARRTASCRRAPRCGTARAAASQTASPARALSRRAAGSGRQQQSRYQDGRPSGPRPRPARSATLAASRPVPRRRRSLARAPGR